MSKNTKDEKIIVREDREAAPRPVEMPKEYWATNSPYVDAYIRALNYANNKVVDRTVEDSEYFEDYEEVSESIPSKTSDRALEKGKQPTRSGKPAGKKPKKKKAPKIYKKRGLFLMLVAIVMLACVVVAGLGMIKPLGGFLAPYLKTNSEAKDDESKSIAVSFIDPIYSLILYFTGGEVEEATAKSADATVDADTETESAIDITKYYYTDMLASYKEFETEGAISTQIIQMIITFALPIIIILFLVTCLYIAIKAIVAMASKKKGKKYKLGYSWFVAFLLLVGTIIMGMVWNGLGINEVGDYLMYGLGEAFGIESLSTSASTISMGLGMWIMLVLMVVGLVLSFFCYKRLEKVSKKGGNKKDLPKAKARAKA